MILMRRLSRSLLIGGTVLAGLAFSGALMPRHAFASYTICRTDPIVHLSNGQSVVVSSAISDTPTDIKKVTYTLHVPVGLGVSGIVYTGGSFAGKESMTVYADNEGGTYTSTTTVQIRANTAVPVTATITVKGSQSGVSTSVSGLSGQVLTAQVLAP
jgi:hypothetical protein